MFVWGGTLFSTHHLVTRWLLCQTTCRILWQRRHHSPCNPWWPQYTALLWLPVLGSDADGHLLIRSLPETLQFLKISLVPCLTTTSPIVAFPPCAHPTCPPPSQSPKFCHVQTPLLASVGGFSAHWHSSWYSKPCWPWRHSFTLIISSSCSLVAILSKGFGGASQKMATQGCCFNARLATTKLSQDSAVLYPCTNRLRNSLSTLNVMNSTNCTPANQLYCCMIPDSHWSPAAGLVVRGSLLCPVSYTPIHHTVFQLQSEHLYVVQWNNYMYMFFNTKCSEHLNCVVLYTQSHFSWLNCITWHTALVQDVTHNPLPVTHHHVLSHSLPGVGRFNPHIIVYIFTIHWGLPSPPFFESSFTSGYSRLRCACDLGNVPWGMVGCTGFRIMGAGPKIRHVSTT